MYRHIEVRCFDASKYIENYVRYPTLCYNECTPWGGVTEAWRRLARVLCGVTDIGRCPCFIRSIYVEVQYFDVSKLSIRYPTLAASEHLGAVRLETFGVNVGDGYRTTVEFYTIT